MLCHDQSHHHGWRRYHNTRCDPYFCDPYFCDLTPISVTPISDPYFLCVTPISCALPLRWTGHDTEGCGGLASRFARNRIRRTAVPHAEGCRPPIPRKRRIVAGFPSESVAGMGRNTQCTPNRVVELVLHDIWSRRSGLNGRPAVYECDQTISKRLGVSNGFPVLYVNTEA